MVCGQQSIVVEGGRGPVRPAPDHTHPGLENAMPKSTKICTSCKKNKAVTEFGRNSKTRDGYRCWCKPCDNLKSREFNRDNPGKYRLYQRAWRQRNPERVGASSAAWKRANPIAHLAHQRLNDAVRSGCILRPACCELCGTKAALDGHHDDYSKWDSVKWLCRPCHKRLHAAKIERVG